MGPGSADRLTSAPGAKKAAAKYVEEQLLPHLRSAGRMGGKPVDGPPGMLGSERELPGRTLQKWKSWQGVEHVLDEWGKQVRNLGQRLQGERDALLGARVLFQTQDGLVRDALAPGADPVAPGLPGNTPTGLRQAG